MHASRFLMGTVFVLATLCAAPLTQAQTALTPAVTGQFQPVESAAPPPPPPPAAPEPAAAPAPAAAEAKKTNEPPPAPAPRGCRPLTDKAASIDLQAATAQAKKRDLTEQLQLVEEAIDLWSMAVDQCDGRAKERAQRNLADNLKAMEKLSEQQGAGPQCEAAHRDASALQDLARQALTERQFNEASVLFRKSEDAWDDASERCTGTQQEVAIKRRDQSEVDGFNAAYCAPVYEKARALTQKLRTSGNTLPREEKQEMSMLAETHWREALTQCKGSVLDIARSNAQTLARERGTAWVARYPIPPPPAQASAERKAPVKAAAAPTASAAQAPAKEAAQGPTPQTASTSITSLAASVGSALSSIVGAGSTGTAAAVPVAGAVTAGAAVAAAVLPEGAKPTVPTAQPPDFVTGGTRFVGKFVRDIDSPTYSGTGKITWANGDSFNGTLQKSLRHGKGVFTWANGQSYDGDWNLDKPVGEAKMRFANGNQYQGSIVNGVPQGQGNMRFASGDTYVGQFNAGVPHGRGVYVWKNGQQYDGEWVNDKAQGRGKLKFANGNVYEGPVVNGVPNGRGKTVFATGEVFEGDVLNGVPHGEGTFTWPNGDEYEGQWRAGKKHGEGAMTWKSGDRWEGTYDNDRQVEHPATPAPPPRASSATVPAPAAAVKK